MHIFRTMVRDQLLSSACISGFQGNFLSDLKDWLPKLSQSTLGKDYTEKEMKRGLEAPSWVILENPAGALNAGKVFM